MEGQVLQIEKLANGRVDLGRHVKWCMCKRITE